MVEAQMTGPPRSDFNFHDYETNRKWNTGSEVAKFQSWPEPVHLPRDPWESKMFFCCLPTSPAQSSAKCRMGALYGSGDPGSTLTTDPGASGHFPSGTQRINRADKVRYTQGSNSSYFTSNLQTPKPLRLMIWAWVLRRMHFVQVSGLQLNNIPGKPCQKGGIYYRAHHKRRYWMYDQKVKEHASKCGITKLKK
jgi:hypothetical protein